MKEVLLDLRSITDDSLNVAKEQLIKQNRGESAELEDSEESTKEISPDAKGNSLLDPDVSPRRKVNKVLTVQLVPHSVREQSMFVPKTCPVEESKLSTCCPIKRS